MTSTQPTTPTLPLWMPATLAVAMLALVAGGSVFYVAQERQARAHATDQLTSVARLNADQIVAWRRDRLRDARELTESPFLAEGIATYLEAPDGPASVLIRDRLRAIRRQHDYADVALLDAQRRIRLNVSSPLHANAALNEALTAAWHTRQAAMTDLHRDADNGTPHISVVTPIFAGADAAGPPLAAIVLINNAAGFLYPLISAWPTPSASGETLLVRRDGDSALFISNLRHRPDSAFTLRIPLSQVAAPAVKAVLGQRGVVEGLDYRGAKVLSAVMPIPGTAWFMVSKVDSVEIFAEWRRRAVLIVLLVTGLLVVLLSVGLQALHRSRKDHYKALYRSEATLRAKEQALRDSEEKFRTLYESSGDAILLLDQFGFVECNATAVRTFGAQSDSQLCAMTPVGLSPERQPDGRDSAVAALEYYHHALEHGSAWFEWTHRRLSDQQLFPAEVLLSRITVGGRLMVQATVRNITERTRAQAEREQLQGALLQAQKMESVGRLAGGVAHDFNNMLGAILGYTEMALARLTPDDELYADLLEVQKAGQRSAELTRQLLAFARKQTIAPRVINLNDTVGGLLKMLRRLIGEDIALVWKPGSNLWPVRMDPSQIDQILANLCVNARDAIAGVGRVTIETNLATIDGAYCAEHPGAIAGDFVRLLVTDDGQGMDPAVMEHLFEPFFTTKRIGEGTGLGLATVYGIVKQNDGFVNVYSEPGRGSTFSIYLPRYVGDCLPDTSDAPDRPPARGHEAVLVVEDEAAMLRVASTALTNLGYEVLPAGTPDEAIQIAESHPTPIHLLLTDVIMPGMNGRELAARLQQRSPALRCLFMSGYTANVIAHRGVLDDGVVFIQKPFSVRDLSRKVREALQDRA